MCCSSAIEQAVLSTQKTYIVNVTMEWKLAVTVLRKQQTPNATKVGLGLYVQVPINFYFKKNICDEFNMIKTQKRFFLPSEPNTNQKQIG